MIDNYKQILIHKSYNKIIETIEDIFIKKPHQRQLHIYLEYFWNAQGHTIIHKKAWLISHIDAIVAIIDNNEIHCVQNKNPIVYGIQATSKFEQDVCGFGHFCIFNEIQKNRNGKPYTHISAAISCRKHDNPVIYKIDHPDKVETPEQFINEFITTIIVKVISSPNGLEKLDRVLNHKWKLFNTFLNKTKYSIPEKPFTIEIYIHPNITEENLLKIKQHKLYSKYFTYIRSWDLKKTTIDFYNKIEKSCTRQWDNYFFSEVFRRKKF